MMYQVFVRPDTRTAYRDGCAMLGLALGAASHTPTITLDRGGEPSGSWKPEIVTDLRDAIGDEDAEVSLFITSHGRLYVTSGDGPGAFAVIPRDGRPAVEMQTTAQVGEALGITPGRVRQLAQSAGVGARRGRDWLFSDGDVDTMRERQTTPGRAPKSD